MTDHAFKFEVHRRALELLRQGSSLMTMAEAVERARVELARQMSREEVRK